MSRLSALAERWRADALVIEGYGAPQLAQALRRCADDLEAAQRDDGAELLTLAGAERESGYSRDRLRHMVADGDIANAGRKGAPRIRRGDLPRKSKATRSVGFDASVIAAELVHGHGQR